MFAKIARSHVVIIPTGMYATHSKCITRESGEEQAHPRGQPPRTTARVLHRLQRRQLAGGLDQEERCRWRLAALPLLINPRVKPRP